MPTYRCVLNSILPVKVPVLKKRVKTLRKPLNCFSKLQHKRKFRNDFMITLKSIIRQSQLPADVFEHYK